MFCEEQQEKSQCFCVSSALLHLTHSILPLFCPISLKWIKERWEKCSNLY